MFRLLWHERRGQIDVSCDRKRGGRICELIANQLPRSIINLVRQGIRVNSISPGFVKTEMTASVSSHPKQGTLISANGQFPHLLDGWKSEAMNGRIAEPEDIMGACVFLASDASAYMTGSDIVVDGGVTRW